MKNFSTVIFLLCFLGLAGCEQPAQSQAQAAAEKPPVETIVVPPEALKPFPKPRARDQSHF